MAKVDKKTVEYVAKLARINLAESQKEPLAKQLSKIIDYIDKLEKLSTDKVEPLKNIHGHSDVLREDTPKPSDCRERILDNAPAREGDYFKIPKVIE